MTLEAASQLLDQLDRPLWIVTAGAGERRGGLVATFVSSASLVASLPRVVVGIACQHFTWELIEASGAFALQLLDEAQVDLVWRFGLQSGRDTDKFASLSTEVGEMGAPMVPGGIASFECRVEARMPTGDRTIYLAEVIAFEERSTPHEPLTMRRLIELAPPDKLQQLKALHEHDAAVDEAAIKCWRETHP